jgi:hypothetical protein
MADDRTEITSNEEFQDGIAIISNLLVEVEDLLTEDNAIEECLEKLAEVEDQLGLLRTYVTNLRGKS